MLKQAVKEAAILLVAAVALGFAVYAVRPDKIQSRAVETASGGNALSGEQNGFANISIEDAFRLYQQDTAIFADARHAADYAAGHIKGAVNLTAAQSEAWLPDLLATTDPQAVIITYCDGENCHLAPELAELLFFNGFDHVFYIENGWTRWRESGYPVD